MSQRPMYSSPPRRGSSIVRTFLWDDKLTDQYYAECDNMAGNIQSMRTKLVEMLDEVGIANMIGLM
jgi:aspartate/tyrosine/aromatic aminotransferase